MASFTYDDFRVALKRAGFEKLRSEKQPISLRSFIELSETPGGRPMSVSLRADSPRCCSSRQPCLRLPHPPVGVSAPPRPDATGRDGRASHGLPLHTPERLARAKSRPLLGRPSPRDWTHTGRIVLRGRKCWVPLTETLELAGVSSSFVVSQV